MEKVTAYNADAQALSGRTDIQKDLIRTDQSGIVPDTLGAIGPRPAIGTFVQQNPGFNAVFKQSLTVYGTFEGQFRKSNNAGEHL